MSDFKPDGPSAGKPLFIDNRDGNTLARAITTHLAALRKDGKTPAELCVATCFSSPRRRSTTRSGTCITCCASS